LNELISHAVNTTHGLQSDIFGAYAGNYFTCDAHQTLDGSRIGFSRRRAVAQHVIDKWWHVRNWWHQLRLSHVTSAMSRSHISLQVHNR